MNTAAFVHATGRRVFTDAANNGGDLWAAAERTWDSLTDAERHHLGIWALTIAEREAFRVLHPTEDGEGGQSAGDTHRIAAPFSRRRLALADADPLLYVVAIGSSGTRKCVGELTREDILAMAAYYGANKRSYAEKETGWRRIASKVPLGKMLAAVAKHLSAKDRAFLLAELGLSVMAA